jgi:hypothetical protein
MTVLENFARRAGAVGRIVCIGSALVLSLAVSASAQAPDTEDKAAMFFRTVELGGLVDGYYVYNSNKTQGDAPYRNFDTKHNQFAFSLGELWLNKSPTGDQRAGFNVKFNVGPASSIIHASEPGTSSAAQNIEQAYVSYLAPIGKGLQIDAGKFVTQHGAEVIEAKDNWNYSRSLLFALAIPYYHMGVRATYVVNDTVTLMGDIVNGWNDVVDNNGRKTYGLQATVKPTSALVIVQNYMGGPEQPNNDTDWRHLSDTTATYTISPVVSLMANYDYGVDTLAGQKVHWDGVATYAKIQATKRVAIGPRVERFTDPDGFMTGTAQTLTEVTMTGEVRVADNLIWRVEFRRDVSDAASFKMDTGAFVKQQSTIGFGLLYSFSTKP